MSIQVSSTAQGGSNQSWSITPLLPSGTIAGDLLIAVSNSFLTLTPGAGWTNLYDVSSADGGLNSRIAAWARLATGTGDEFHSAANFDAAIIVLRITGHAVVTIASHIFKTSVTLANTTTPNPPNESPGSSKEWLWLAAGYAGCATTGFTAVPSGMTDRGKQTSLAGTIKYAVAVASLVQTGSSYDPATFTCGTLSPAGSNTGGVTFAVTPAPPVTKFGVVSGSMHGLDGTIPIVKKQTYSKPPRKYIWVYGLTGTRVNVLD